MLKPLLTPGGKDLIPNSNKSMVIYQLSCCCKASCRIDITKTRKVVKEHVLKSVDNF